jgi:hypothetical protein
MTRKVLSPLSLLTLAVVANVGCVVVNQEPPPDPYGDIAFSWSFAGETDCDLAGVDELDIVILQGGEVMEVIEREPCVGSGLVLTDFLAGRYEVEVDAFNRRSELAYSGDFSIRVEGGRENDAGVVVLDSLGPPPPPPPPATGDLALFWAFLYPTDQPIIDCALAGVVDVDIALTGPAGEVITERFPCGDDGATFVNLGVGRWSMELDAFGFYRNQDLHLYAATVTVDVVADVETDLGDVPLARDDDNFADIQVEWGFNASSCADAGIVDVAISIQRTGLDQPEDTTTVACEALSELRQTFVPGSYTIRVRGLGTVDAWSSAATIDLAPNTLAVVPVQLAPEA